LVWASNRLVKNPHETNVFIATGATEAGDGVGTE